MQTALGVLKGHLKGDNGTEDYPDEEVSVGSLPPAGTTVTSVVATPGTTNPQTSCQGDRMHDRYGRRTEHGPTTTGLALITASESKIEEMSHGKGPKYDLGLENIDNHEREGQAQD